MLLESTKEEYNRCFFIHVGVATGIHPFYLQQRFREEAHRLLEVLREDDACFEELSLVVERCCYVDCEAMRFLWGLIPELAQYRLTLIRFNDQGSRHPDGNIIYSYQDVRTYQSKEGTTTTRTVGIPI